MKTMYETVVDDIGNWDCFLVLVNEDGLIERVEDDVKSDPEHLSYLSMCREFIGHDFDLVFPRENTINQMEEMGVFYVFYLFSSTPCTGERAWFIRICRENGLDYRLLSACWEINND